MKSLILSPALIDTNIGIMADREYCAFDGLSVVAAQTLRIGLNRPDQLAYIGGFGPAIEIAAVAKDYDGALANVEKINRQLRLLWLGIGTDDVLFAPVESSHEVLEQAGIKHVWVESSGAHVWTVWRKYLADFAPRLFR